MTKKSDFCSKKLLIGEKKDDIMPLDDFFCKIQLLDSYVSKIFIDIFFEKNLGN